MKIEKLVVGQLQTNCYLVWEEKTKKAIVIDPGDAADYILNRIKDLELDPKLIVLTHGHFDHILGLPELKLALGIPILAQPKDLFLIKRARASARHWLGIEADPPVMPDKFIQEGDKIRFGGEELKVLETPGHSPGGLAFYSRGILFSGDTLFCQGIGRYDFSYASFDDLKRSLKKLLKLPAKTKVYPGHGLETTIDKEKEFLKDFLAS